MNWQPGTTAPKTGNPFVARINQWPFIVMCAWNGVENQWAYTDLQVDMYHGKWNDVYFATEYCDENELISWVDIEQEEKQQ